MNRILIATLVIKIMLKQTVNSRMHIEGEEITISPSVSDEFKNGNKRINRRVYNECGDVSKASLVSDELDTLRTDLYNATKSLEKSLLMAEGLKVKKFPFIKPINILNTRSVFG